MILALQEAYDRKLHLLEHHRQTKQRDIIAEKNERLQEIIEKEIFDAYVEYQRNLLKETDSGYGNTRDDFFPDEHKIKVVRNIFGVMENQNQNFGAGKSLILNSF